MTVLIYGGGAVGLGIASCLLKAGTEVTVLARDETASLLRQEGLIRTGIFGPAFAAPGTFDAISDLRDLEGRRFDHVLVCTKSFDSEQAALDIYEHRPLLRRDGCIVLFQNGWGNAEILAQFLPKEVIYNARVITGFIRRAKNQVEVTVHADAIHVGSLYSGDRARIAPLCQAISAGGIPCEAVAEIGKDLWAKMLFNCPLNALGAIFQVPYGALGESERTRRVMELIIEEIFEVMRAAGYATYWRSPAEYLLKFYGELIPLTALHLSSTLQDLRAGKRTEIDALNGAVVELGRAHGVSVPANEVVYHMIKYMESGGKPGLPQRTQSTQRNRAS
ncbi:MAG: 2-dehydropantoate 2-reductase [Anaerolineae bacterium]|nr:2-dehydropantoate 2-reductase [Anaerolineae bacterium]